MGLSAALKKALNKIESQMARGGFALGDSLNSVIGALDNGVFNASDAANTETSTANGGALSIAKLVSLISSAGAETRTLASPAAGHVGLKVIRMSVDGGAVTMAAANILGYTTEAATFDDVGDTLILMSNGAGKWVVIGGNVAIA